jgi:hypothetical protein
MDQDQQFFARFPDRRARIRLPGREPFRDQQRAVRYLDEAELQFRSLGPHDPKRRRIIVYKTPADHPTHANHLLKIPFLMFADEAIADDDKTLLTIIHEMMLERARR